MEHVEPIGETEPMEGAKRLGHNPYLDRSSYLSNSDHKGRQRVRNLHVEAIKQYNLSLIPLVIRILKITIKQVEA